MSENNISHIQGDIWIDYEDIDKYYTVQFRSAPYTLRKDNLMKGMNHQSNFVYERSCVMLYL